MFDKPGHRVTGDRTQNTPRAGWQALHVAIDDHSRVGFSLMLADEKAVCLRLPPDRLALLQAVCPSSA